MLTGELRSKIDNVRNAFWAGGIANPLEVIEQINLSPVHARAG
jgi:type I restriction enzyme M protein